MSFSCVCAADVCVSLCAYQGALVDLRSVASTSGENQNVTQRAHMSCQMDAFTMCMLSLSSLLYHVCTCESIVLRVCVPLCLS